MLLLILFALCPLSLHVCVRILDIEPLCDGSTAIASAAIDTYDVTSLLLL